MTAPLSHAGSWDDIDVPVLTDLAPETIHRSAQAASANSSSESTSSLVMDELPLLELDIPLDFQLYSAEDPARDVAPVPFDDLPLLGDEPQYLVESITPQVQTDVLTKTEAEPFEVHFEPAPQATETVVRPAAIPVGGLSSIPLEALPHGVLGGGVAALDNTDMLASIEKRLAALRAATGIGPGGIELRPSEPEPEAVAPVVSGVPEPEASVSAEPLIETVVTPNEMHEPLSFVAAVDSLELVPTVGSEVAPASEVSEEAFDVSALPFELAEPELTAPAEPTVSSVEAVDDWAAAPAVQQVLPVAEIAVPGEPVIAPLHLAPPVAASAAETAGKSVAVVGESVLIESLYQMIMPRMKAELSLWLQDAIKMQNEQLLEGVMRQLKTDYDMMFGETLRESLRQAVADVSRTSHKEQG
ncbi:hypothetical protein OL229_01805 [Neisseriaceae bacterium JH1-16]|nr:hypothetical protein [Neisseriaceae bacterium JH1-16]